MAERKLHKLFFAEKMTQELSTILDEKRKYL